MRAGLLAVVLRTALAALAIGIPMGAEAAVVPATFGQRLVSAGDWVDGTGVDVFSNGRPGYVCTDAPPSGWRPEDCKSSVTVDGKSRYVGIKWQCVELAQRLWVTRGWWSGSFGVNAYMIWEWARLNDLARTANGSLKASDLHFGDLVVWTSAVGRGYGHVAVVDYVDGSSIHVKEQNWGDDGKQTGKSAYTLAGGWLSGNGYTNNSTKNVIYGVVHHADSPTTPPPTKSSTVDLVFAIDTTGSMTPYIDGVKASASSIVNKVMTTSDARVGLVDYRDLYSSCPEDGYAARIDLPFSSDTAAILAAINGLAIGDGCDIPESVYSGLMTAIGFPWRDGIKKAIILMGDAPPHDPEAETGFTLSAVVNAALAVDPANVYVIDNGGGDAYFADLASGTGATYVPASSPEDAVDAIVKAVTAIGRAPVATMGGPYLGMVGETFVFDGSGSYSPFGTVVGWEWDFDNDGIFDLVDTAPTVEHAYPAPYDGLAVLRVTDDATEPQTATSIAEVQVLNAPVPTSSPSPRPTPTPTLRPSPSPSPTPVRSGAPTAGAIPSPTPDPTTTSAAESPRGSPPAAPIEENRTPRDGMSGPQIIALMLIATLLAIGVLLAASSSFRRSGRGGPPSGA